MWKEIEVGRCRRDKCTVTDRNAACMYVCVYVLETVKSSHDLRSICVLVDSTEGVSTKWEEQTLVVGKIVQPKRRIVDE